MTFQRVAAGWSLRLERAHRKLNEERKMRIPYVDGQTGVANGHEALLQHEDGLGEDAWETGGPGRVSFITTHHP